MFFLFLLLFHLVLSQIDKPVITDLQQNNENTVLIKWIYRKSNPQKNHRLRVQFSKDNFHYDLNEWPVNFEKVNSTSGELIESASAKSNFECLLRCIKNFECNYLIYKFDIINNCYLKKNSANESSLKWENEDNFHLTDSNREIVIKKFPYNDLYRFRVMVYDEIEKKWTQFSDASHQHLDTRINLFITVERVGNTSLKISWKQIGLFKNYPISRYNIQTSINEEPFKDNFDSKFLSSETNYPNFFELPLPPTIGTCKSEQECFTKCSKVHDCIKYAFNITHGNCHLINSFDPINGIKVPTIVSRSIISSSNQFILDDLKLFSNYKIKLSYKTPLGIQRSSNLISYVLTKLKPYLRIQVENTDFTVALNWTIIEPVKLRTYLIHSSINESSYFDQYFESNLHDFDDPTQSMHHLNLNDCFYKCALNTSCLAFTWNRFENKCFLKSNKNRTRMCDPNYFCSSIMEYNSLIRIKNHFVNTKYCYMISVLSFFGFAGEKSNKVCFKWNVTVSLNSDSKFKEGSRATLRCNITGITMEQLDHLKWIKNSIVLSDAKLSQSSFHLDKLNLELYSLNYSKDNGIYLCEITLTNGQILVSNKLDLKVDFGPQIKLISDSNQLTIMQGDRVNISCSSIGYPIPDIKFKKNNKKIENFIEIYDYKSFRKTIFLNIEKSLFNLHNGTYSCYLDKLLKKDFDLFIRFGPFFANKSSDILVNEFHSASIECSISKHPTPKLKWNEKIKKNNQLNYQLKFSNETFGTSVLRFENVSRNDMGEYSCIDEEYPNMSQNYMLYVHFPSSLKNENQTEVYQLTQNSFVEFDCVSVGYPIVNIEWKFDSFNVDLNPSKAFNSTWNQTSILILENLNKNDQGNYSCGFVIDNVEHKKYFRIIIQSKPKSPILVSGEEIEGGLIKVIWYIEDIGNCALVGAVIEWADSFESSSIKSLSFKFSESLQQEKKHYEIKLKLKIPKNNFIRLAVENSIGRSEPSDAKYLSRKPTDTSQLEKIKLKTIFALIAVLIVVFLIVGLFVAILFRLRRDFNKKSQLNHESKCKLNDTIESRSLQQIESVSTNLNRGDARFSFLDNLISKMSDKRVGAGLNSPRSHSGPNFGIFSRITSLKRKDSKKAKKTECLDSTISDINLIDKHINLPITLKNLTSQLELMNDNFAKTYTKESLLKRFTQDLESLDKDMHFEFCEIKNPINKSFHDSLKIQNERKSRYKHVYPYDDNRVKLSLVPGRPDSDFINASYIEGHNQSKRFIAAQGPTKDTTEDFLRMIVEKNVKIIVMLTKIYEGDPPILKCWPYWNDKNLIKFGLSSCEVKSIENKLFYEKRKLKIKYKDAHCLADHYYYKEWPDRSSPLESQSIIELIDGLVRNLESNPILVHCSAGIGRTGTFVALFNLMDVMKDSNIVSPNITVYEMRRQRAYSVQNWEQYKFIHQALLEWFMFSNSTFNVTNKDSIKSILSNKNCLENEFLEILNLKDTFKIKTYSFMNIIKCSSIHELIRRDIEYNPSNSKENIDDFKLLDFLLLKTPPFNINFVLSTEPTSKNINLYLTAIFRLKPEIIVSISPKENSYFSVLNETSIDKSLVCGIVVLCQEVKSNEFFKEFELELIDTKSKNKSIKIRYFTTQKLWTKENVSNTSNNSSTYIPDNLFEQNEKKIKEIDTDQEENDSKNSGIFPVSNNESIIKLFDALAEYMDTKSDFLTSSSTGLSKSKNNIILVQAQKKLNDSIEKHGLFISLMYLYYNIKIKNEFNIVQIVRLLRKTYPRLLNKQEYYDYLYNFCLSDSLTTY